jgi:hypothetical protein
MMHLEHELERALARKSAPDGFAAKVMNAIQADARPSPGPSGPPLPEGEGWRRFTRPIAAGILLTAIAGGWAAEKAVERRQGERAREEVLVALHIASSKVRTAQQHIHEIGSH